MIICRCNQVSRQEISRILSKHNNANFDDIKTLTGAAASCGRCTPLVKNLIEKLTLKLAGKQQSNKQLKLPF